MLPLDGDRKPAPLLRTEFNEGNGSFSPDGMQLYQSNESGGMKSMCGLVASDLVRRSAKAKGRYLGRRNEPGWRADGKEIIFNFAAAIMSVDQTASAPRPDGDPKQLFRLQATMDDVTGDGKAS